MAQKRIVTIPDVEANSGDGTPLATAFQWINENFDELYQDESQGEVNSIVAGTGVSVSSATGDVTVTNSAPNATHTGEVTGATELTITSGAVTTEKLANNSVNSDKLNVSGTGTLGQALLSDGDGSFSWGSAGGGGVQGTGTTNRVPVFTDETTIGDSNIFANGSSVQMTSNDGSVPAELTLWNFGTFNTYEPTSKMNLKYGGGSGFSIFTEEHPAFSYHPELVIAGGSFNTPYTEFIRIDSLDNTVNIGQGGSGSGKYAEFQASTGQLQLNQFELDSQHPNLSILSPTKQIMQFVNAVSFSTVGNISIDGTSTSYNTASDYRLKEDFQPISNSLDKLDALKPINFAWKNGGKRVDGFLAHEVAEVIPEAVTGEKDGTEEYTIKEEIKDKDGNIIQEGEIGVRNAYQAIDQSKIVPLLTAALQEANQLIKDLTARVEVLENN